MVTRSVMKQQTAKQSLNYAALFKSLATAFIIFGTDDPTFTILDENEAHAALAGLKRDDVVGRPLFDVFPDMSEEYVKRGHSQLLESIRKVIATGKPDALPNLHYDIKDSKGNMQSRYWSVVHEPIVDADGKVVAVYQQTTDLTEETVAQQHLMSAQYQLDQVLKVSSVGTWTWNVTTKTISGDRTMAKLFGLDPDEVAAGLPASAYNDAVHPDDRERVTKQFSDAVANRRPYECQYRTIDADDEVRWVISRGYFDSSDQAATTSPGVTMDITERKRAEDNLNFLTNATMQFSANIGYTKTLRSIAQMVVPEIADWCTIDVLEDGQIQQVALAHKDPKKVKWAKKLREEQGPPKLDDPIGVAKVIRTGEVEYYPDIPHEMLMSLAKNDEERRIIEEIGFSSVIIAPMMLDDQPIGALTFVATESRLHYKPIDLELAKIVANRAALAVYNSTLYEEAQSELRDRKQLQDDLELLNDELENRVEQRTAELRKTNEGLEKEIRRRHRAEKVLDKYSKELARSNQELQDFAYVASHDLQEPLRKIQAFGDLLSSEYEAELGANGKEYLTRMRNAASRMSVLIEDLLAFSRVTTKAHPNTEVDLAVTAKEVIGDLETRIKDTHGKVEVGPLPTVWADDTHMRQLFQNLIGNALKFHREDVPPVVKVYAKPLKAADKSYTIYVEDNGIGFDEKYLDRIFSVFQRLHGKAEYEGTGIGLAVCRKIAERYGGTITAASKKGHGSTFIFSIPVKKGKETNQHERS